MSAILAPSVPALVRASLRAYRTAESKCLCATLSALWNLASHSRDNKKALCEEPGFLEMLIELSTNDAQHTALVEPATGVLKYASMYLAVVGTVQYLSTSVIHVMMLRLIDLLNSPSFTVIGNALGILSQLLAKGHQLRSLIVLNHKAMLLLNHLRNSTRDDIRNPVKTILNYLNSFDVSEVYVPTSAHSSTHGTPPLTYRFDGMSSSYDGTASVAPSCMDSTRLLKYRSSHSYAASVLPGNISSTLNTEYFPYSSPSCASTMQHGFAPRPGDRPHHQEQFASLPRQFFQKSKISNASSVGDDSNMYLKQMQAASRFSPSVITVRHPIHPGQKNMSTSTTTTNGLVVESPQGPNLSNGENGDSDGLNGLNRPDDPSFEVEDSVRCTRCTSTQSLSSLFPGERSTWNSCNNSAADSNRLSPVSATEIPDSPTQCAPLADTTILSARDLDSTEENEMRNEVNISKEVLLEAPKSNTRQSNNGEKNFVSKSDINTKANTEQENSLDDDYGSFMGRADSELLNQSIESAMPKRVEINEEFLADMIEQAQPKSCPLKQHGSSGGRNFSRATAKSSSAKIDNDDFLLQSIASVLPQSSSSTHDMSGVGSPPKKARAMTGDTARMSGGPKRTSHAVVSNSRSHLTHSCSVLRTKQLRLNGINLKTKFGNKITASNSAALFDAALRSSFVESPKTTEKIRNASLLIHQDTNEESDTLSEDNYSPLTDNIAIDKNVPQDIDEESQAEQLVIDCSVVSETVKQTVIKPMQKESCVQTNTSNRFALTQKSVEKQLSEQEIFTLPAPLSNCSTRNCSPCNPIVTSTPRSSKLLNKFPVKTRNHNASISKSMQEKVSASSTVTIRTRDSCNGAVKSSEDGRNRGPHHARSLPKLKQSILPKAKLTPTSSSSSSKMSVPRAEACHRAAILDTSKISQNCANSVYETIKAQNVLIQELARKRSFKVLPLNHRNVNEKTASVAVVPENNSKKETVKADTENDNGTQCDNHSPARREKTIKQMLVTTV
ncbi:hypothetical protein ACH3XW_14855 [Acanthocheilonema viteae]